MESVQYLCAQQVLGDHGLWAWAQAQGCPTGLWIGREPGLGQDRPTDWYYFNSYQTSLITDHLSCVPMAVRAGAVTSG